MTIVSIEEARSTIRRILQGDDARIQPAPHCRQRMIQRQVFIEDILHVLFWGTVKHGTQAGDAKNNIFRVAGADLEGVPLTLVIRIVVAQKFIEIISVFGEMHNGT